MSLIIVIPSNTLIQWISQVMSILTSARLLHTLHIQASSHRPRILNGNLLT